MHRNEDSDFFTHLYVYWRLSITAGYHRLFSHQAYKAHPVVRFMFAITMLQFEGSVIDWCTDHATISIVKQKDPYSITEVFWHTIWAG